MEKLLLLFLLMFILTGCNPSVESDVKTEERTLQEIKQDETQDEHTVVVTESEELSTEITSSSEDKIVSEERTTEVYTTEQLDKDTDYYAVCSTYSKEEIESYAKTIKKIILNKEWEELADRISYPITIENFECKSEEDFKKISFDEMLTDDFYTALENESCEEMFCNYAGIMLGNGQVWIAEIIDEGSGEGELKIIAINP